MNSDIKLIEKIKEAGISLVFLVCAAAAFYFFWRNLTGTLTKLNEEPIAEVTLKNRTVQRRFSGRLNWSMLETKSLLYNGDVIRTGEEAGVAVRFVSGDSFQLDKESMVQIFWTKASGVQIDVSRGDNINVRSVSEKPVVLLSGGKKIEVQRGEEKSVSVINIPAEAGKAETTELTEKKPLEPIQTLSDAALAQTAAEEAKEAEKLAASDLPPPPPTEPAKPVQIKESNSAPGKVELDVSAETPVRNAKIVLQKDGGPLPAGRYTFALQAESPDGSDISAQNTGVFTVPSNPLAAPVRLRPARNYKIDRAALEKSRSLTLSWGAGGGAGNVYYIITLQKEGGGVFYQSAPLRNSSYTIEDVMTQGEGRIIWQVEAVQLDSTGLIERRSGASSSSFVIDLAPLAAPEPVE